MPLDPYFSAGKLTWLLEHDDEVARARDAGTAAARHRRLVPLRPARRRLRDRPLDRLAHPARGSRLGPGPARDLRRAGRARCPRSWTRPATSARCATPPGRSSCPLRARCVDQQAALAGAGCVEPGLVKATYGTGVFVLAHAGDERPEPGRRPPAHRRLAGGRARRVGDRRRRVHRRRAARVAEPRPRPGRRPGRARRRRGRGRGRGRRAGAAGARRRRRPVVGVRGARGGGRADVGNATGPHRAGRAGGDRLAGGGRGRRRARDGARRGPAGRRRPDARSHAPPASGRRCRRPRSARRRGRHRRRSGRARPRSERASGARRSRSPSEFPSGSAPSRGEMPHGGSARTPSGASS